MVPTQQGILRLDSVLQYITTFALSVLVEVFTRPELFAELPV